MTKSLANFTYVQPSSGGRGWALPAPVRDQDCTLAAMEVEIDGEASESPVLVAMMDERAVTPASLQDLFSWPTRAINDMRTSRFRSLGPVALARVVLLFNCGLHMRSFYSGQDSACQALRMLGETLIYEGLLSPDELNIYNTHGCDSEPVCRS